MSEMVIYRYWERNDVKGAIGAKEKMADHAVLSDVISIVADKIDIAFEHFPGHAAEAGQNVWFNDNSTLSASTSVGVDIEAEQRLERCNICFVELEKVKRCLLTLTRKGGSVAKYAHELNLALQEVS
ncbi:hypothetical protein NC652_022339 [Populus alba x Populus x berolinensis]|nr:hypothetical protein NC652_022339 [Populus alba x Populus x berolinensis]